jgi:formylglycine-generating enzyme required for sulfatase activity
MRALTLALLVAAALAAPAAAARKCPPDSVRAGDTCLDRYEGSIWLVPDPTKGNKGLVKKIQKGKVTLADLEAGGATQLGCEGAPFQHTFFPDTFPVDGSWTPLAGSDPPTPGIYAVSIPLVLPTACVSWFQADQACALSGKRLPTQEEWQRAVAGTPDPQDADDYLSTCNTVNPLPTPTGSRMNCVSHYGAFDMIGGQNEWVAEWRDKNGGTCSNEGVADLSCFGGQGGTPVPGGVLRGGSHGLGIEAGSFAIFSTLLPNDDPPDTGFRCAR